MYYRPYVTYSPDWELIFGIIGPILMMWLIGLGVCTILGKASWYTGKSKKVFIAPFKALWSKHRKAILLIGVGILIGCFMSASFRF